MIIKIPTHQREASNKCLSTYVKDSFIGWIKLKGKNAKKKRVKDNLWQCNS